MTRTGTGSPTSGVSVRRIREHMFVLQSPVAALRIERRSAVSPRLKPIIGPRLPHPIPYQGSKRRLALAILELVADQRWSTLYEPFAGSAAITIAASSRRLADRFVISDSLTPLVQIWSMILERPGPFADEYEEIWRGQLAEGTLHFNRVREEFNLEPEPAKLLYLLARCVKNAPRFNKRGGFSQSADHRRRGMRPDKMRRELIGVHGLLRGVTDTFAGDAEEAVREAGTTDLVYLDPPWQGTTEGTDTRYHQGFARSRLETLLADLNDRRVPWILSYDGQLGSKTYGEKLSADLFGEHYLLEAGRSSQATLVGRVEATLESVYLSKSLADRGTRGVSAQEPLFAA